MTAVGVYRGLASATHATIRPVVGRWWLLVAVWASAAVPAELVQSPTFTNSPVMPAPGHGVVECRR